MSAHDWIDDDLFREIHRVSVIACVDVVCVRHDTVLLLKREMEPEKGVWWFPGGRIRKGERAWMAANRILREEAGLHAPTVMNIGCDETEFGKDPFGHGAKSQTLNVICRARVDQGEVILDSRHSAHQWVTQADVGDRKYSHYVRYWVRMAMNL